MSGMKDSMAFVGMNAAHNDFESNWPVHGFLNTELFFDFGVPLRISVNSGNEKTDAQDGAPPLLYGGEFGI